MGRKKEEPEVTAPLGRPSNYSPAFCDLVVQYGRQGMSLVEIASELQISRTSMYDWAQKFPEFSTALTRAREESQAWWERVGRFGIFRGDNEIDSNLWFRNITNRFKADWGQTKAPEVEALDTIDAKPIAIDADKLDPEKRELLKSLLLELRQIGEAESGK